MADPQSATAKWPPGHLLRAAGRRVCRLRWRALPILVLLTLVTLQPPDFPSWPAIQGLAGTCGNGICELDESMPGCPEDCGILLVAEDFEDGQVQGWYYDPVGWEIITEGDTHVWRTTQQAYASSSWARDLAWFLRARRVNSDANLYFRTSWSNNYGLRLEATRLALWTELNGFPEDLATADLAIGTLWHQYRIQAVGHQVSVSVDGNLVLSFTDGEAGALSGGFALEAYAADGARFDDIYLYSLNPQCYDGIKNGDETGVDCGGSCPFQDCCANRAWDAALGEGGVDCGGSCPLACQPAQRLDRWTQTNGPWLEYIRRIRLDPEDPATLQVSSNTGSGVIKSNDAGQTWQENSGPPGAGGLSPMNIFGLAMDPLDKDTLYAGAANGRLFVTHDGGATWSLLWHYTDMDDAIWTLEVDPTDSNRLLAGMGDYTGCDGRLYLSSDRGQTWQKVLDVDPSNDWDNGFISSLAFDPTNPNILYTTTGIGDWCGGGSPGDPNPVGFGIWKSTDRGASWFPINTGLADLTVSHLVIDPSNPQTLYAAVGCVDDDIQLAGNVFKSTDGGAHWQMLSGVSPDAPVTRLALHPADPHKVYALGYLGVFLSEDGGTTWKKLDETIKAAAHGFFYEHVFAPGDPQTMYAGTYSGGILKSVDGGLNWYEINGLRHQGTVLGNSYGTALDPTDPDTVYATTIGGTFKTTDGGEMWHRIGQGTFSADRQIAIDPTDPLRLYMGADSQNFYVSNDGGETWIQVALSPSAQGAAVLLQPGSDVQYQAIAVDPFSPNRVLVAAHRAPNAPLLRSTDYGQTWQVPALGFQASAHALAFHPTQPGAVFAGLGWWPGQPRLVRSDDGGLTWADAAPGLNLTTVYQMVETDGILRAATNGSGVHTRWPGDPVIWESTSAISPGNNLSYVTRLATGGQTPADLLAFDKGDRTVYRLVDGNLPWQPTLHLEKEGDEVYDLLYDPHATEQAYATTRLSGLWRSTDRGATWAPANSGLPGEATLRGLAADPTPGGALYVGQTGTPGRLYTSTDAGLSWAPLNDELTFTTIHAFAADPSDPDVAYAGAWGGGTWKTTDGGATWVRLAEAPVSAAALVIDPHDPQTIYATDRTEPTLWQSSDGGQHWWRRFQAGEAYSRLQALAVDPHQVGVVYFSAFKRGGYGAEGSLFRLTPTGFNDVTGALPRVAISLTVSPSLPGLLLASTHIYGLYRSTDSGLNWTAVAGGLPRVGFNAMAWEPGSGVLWAGACSGSFPDYLRPPGLPDGDDQPGLYRSTDGGLTWQKRLAGPVGKGFAFTSAAVYAAAGDRIYLSRDGGQTWMPQPGGPALGMSAVATAGSRLYAATLGGGVHTALILSDHTVAWQDSQGPQAEIHALQLLGLPGALYATAFPGGVFKSTDGGASWGEANFGLPGFSLPDPARNGYYALVANPTNPDNLYLGIYGYGVYRSEDGAATWLPANTGLGNRYIYSLLVEGNGDYIWAGTNDGLQGLWRSPTGTPGRLSWAPAPDAPPSFQAITGIEINPENPAEMTVAAFPAGVFHTPDSGAHWYEQSNGLYVTKLRTHGTGFEDGYYQLAQDPLNPRHLFFGTYGGQVYETRDGGQSWSAFDQGLMREGSIYAFEIAADGSRLYISQKAGGVSRRALDPTAPQVRVVASDGPPCTAGSHQYATVTAALAASHAGDQVVVCPGHYGESVTLDQAVRLEAFAGPSSTYLRSATLSRTGARLAGFWLAELILQPGVEADLLGNLVLGNNLYLPQVLRVK